jgi:hypothetical protein
MSIEQVIAVLCLGIIGALSTVAVFSRHFDDTLLQRVALAILAIGALARIPHRWETPEVPPELLLIDIGVALYAVATVAKLRRASRRQPERRRGRGAAWR